MALPTLDSVFASAADLPRRQMLAQWLVNLQYSGSVADYWTLPEHYLWAKIAVAAGAPRSEADYISLPKNYVWSDLYNAVSGSSGHTIDRGEKEAIGWIAAAVRGDSGDPVKVATYINWPWRYQVASIITALAVDADAQSFITTSGATDIEAIDQFVKGVKNLGLWNSMVCWPLRSTQNAGTGTTAYSLGGLGTYDGTLVNGPTWGTAGIEFTSTTQRITRSGFDTPASPMTFGMVGDKSNTAASMRLNSLGAYPKRYSNADIINSRILDIRNNNNSQIYGWPAPVATGFVYRSASITGNLTADGYVNGSGVSPSVTNIGATGWNDSAGDSPLLLYASAASDAVIRAAFFYVLKDVAATASQQSALYSLYKSTLGTGLSLP